MGNDEELITCARRWPGVTVERAAFEAHLAQFGWTEHYPDTTPELYLCFATGQGDPTALSCFERTYTPHLLEGIRRIRHAHDFVDDTLQTVRERLLLGAPPKLWAYSGRGSLVTWLRTVGSRAALDRLRALRGREQPNADLTLVLAAETHLDSQLDARLHAEDVARCFRAALATLPARARNVLRMHYAAGLSIDVIGKSYSVHRATAARWLVQAREDFATALRAELTRSMGTLTDAELRALVNSVRTRLDVLISSWHCAQSATTERHGGPNR